MAPEQTKEARRYRRIKICLMLLSIAAVFVWLVPTLIPTSYLHRRVHAAIAEMLNGPVELGEVQLSWSRGIRLSNLTIDDRAASGMRLSVGNVIVPLHPLRLLWHQRVECIHVENVRVEIDAEQYRVLPIALPPWIERLQVSHCHVEVAWPDAAVTSATIPWIQFALDVRSETTNWSGHGRVQYQSATTTQAETTGWISSSGKLKVVEQAGQTCYSGKVVVRWQDMDLSALRLDQRPSLGLQRLAGRSSGRLTFDIFSDFHFAWNAKIDFENVELLRDEGSRPSRTKKLALSLAGEYDPVTGKFDLGALDLTSSVLELQSQCRGYFGPDGLSISDVAMLGSFDLNVLREQIPGLAQTLGPSGKLSGPCKFQASWRNNQLLEDLAIQIRATEARIDIPAVLTKPSGTPLTMELRLNGDRSSWPWMNIRQLSIRLADTQLSGEGRIPRFQIGDDVAWWLDRVRCLADLTLHAECEHIEQLGLHVPLCREFLDRTNASGPVELQLAFTGQDEYAKARATLSLARSTSLSFGRWWVKPAGRAAQLDLQGQWTWFDPVPQLWFGFALSGDPGRVTTPQRSGRLAWSVHPSPSGQTELDVAFDVPLSVTAMDHLISYSPRLMEATAETLHVKGQTDLHLQGALRATTTDRQWHVDLARVQFALDATETGVDVSQQFVKKVGVPLKSSAEFRYAAGQSQRFDWRLVWQQLQTTLTLRRIEGHHAEVLGDYYINIADIPRTLSGMPALAHHVAEVGQFSGGLQTHFSWQTGSPRDSISWDIDATDLGVTLDGQEIKLPGVNCLFKGSLHGSEQDDTLLEYGTSEVNLRLGNSFLNVTSGQLTTEKVAGGKWVKMLGVEPLLAWQHVPVKSMDIQLEGRLSFGSELLTLSNQFAKWCQIHQAAGVADFSATSKLHEGELATSVNVNLDNFSFAFRDLLNKPTETPGSATLSAVFWPGKQRNRYGCRLKQADLHVGPVTMSAKGYSTFDWQVGQAPQLQQGQLMLTVTPTDLEHVRTLSTPVAQTSAAGRMTGGAHAFWQDGHVGLGPSHLQFDNVLATIANRPVWLDGRIDFSSDYVNCDELRILAGQSTMTASSQLCIRAPNGLIVPQQCRVFGVVDVKGQVVDVIELRTMADELRRILAKSVQRKATTTTQPTPPNKFADPQQYETLRNVLARSKFVLAFEADELRTIDPRSGMRHNLRHLYGRVDFDRNGEDRPTGALQFHGGMYDGYVAGTFTALLDEVNPTLTLQSELVNLKMNPSLQPMVEDFFPGMNVSDRITITENSQQKLFNTPDLAGNFPVGTGEMVFTDGLLVGKAAPDAVTKIFPGLDFAKYNFGRMHNWFIKYADGRVHNNMVFRGWPYNIYIEGDSYPDGRVKYDVGVDFFARYESEYWSSTGQGRVLIFSTTARIVDRKFEDHKIMYRPASLIKTLLVRNNPIWTAYLAIKQQIEKRQTPND